MVYKEKKMVDKFMRGGFGYGVACIPKSLIDIILIIIFPPIYVVYKQIISYKKAKKRGKNVYIIHYINIKEILMNVFLTSLFYIPGFIHALTLKTKQCEGLL